jgi:hypothetical protein
LGQAPAHPKRDHEKYPVHEVDRAGALTVVACVLLLAEGAGSAAQQHGASCSNDSCYKGRNGDMIGRLRVFNGTIVLVPKNAQHGYKLGWVKFDELMREHAQHEKG